MAAAAGGERRGFQCLPHRRHGGRTQSPPSEKIFRESQRHVDRLITMKSLSSLSAETSTHTTKTMH